MAQTEFKGKKVEELLKEPLPAEIKKAIIAQSYTWKFGLTRVREIRAKEVGSVFFDKKIEDLMISPASAVYRDDKGLPMDRPPEKKEEKK